MYKKTILLILFITSSMKHYADQSNQKSFSQCSDKQTELLKQQLEAQEKQNALQEKILELLLLQLQLKAQQMQEKAQDQANRQAAFKAEAEKGFSFNECGITIRDTFFEEFNLRIFSLEFCQGFIKTLKKMILAKIIQESFNGVDYAFGTALTRHVHPQAGIYPITFLQSNSLKEYAHKRKDYIEQEDPQVRALHAQIDALLKEKKITQAKLDAQKRERTVQNVIHEEEDEVKAIHKQADQILTDNGINPAKLDAKERLKAAQLAAAAQDPQAKEARQKYDDYRNANLSRIAKLEEEQKFNALKRLLSGTNEDTMRGRLAKEFLDYLRKDIRDTMQNAQQRDHRLFDDVTNDDDITTPRSRTTTAPSSPTRPSAQPSVDDAD